MGIKTDNTFLTMQDTNALKGLALLFLLWHHLFFVRNGLYDDINLVGNVYLVQEIGMMSKICVAIFVFLSGYGLMLKTEKNGGVINLKAFYYHRYKKLFLNYWLIWLLFVPISVIGFGYTFTEAYKYDVAQQLLLDLFGLHDVFYHYPSTCYNPTWWFISCIGLLYALFPFLYKGMKKDPLTVFFLAVVVSFLPLDALAIIQYYLIAFIMGMWMVKSKYPPPTMGSNCYHRCFPFCRKDNQCLSAFYGLFDNPYHCTNVQRC